MTEQFYYYLVELYERRDVPARIKKRIELVLNEYNRLRETRLQPLTLKTIQQPSMFWASPPIKPISESESESTSNVDIGATIEVISKIEPGIHLDLLESNSIKNKARHLETLSKPTVAFESDPWLKDDIEKVIRRTEYQHLKIISDVRRDLSVDLPAGFKLSEY